LTNLKLANVCEGNSCLGTTDADRLVAAAVLEG